MRCLLSQSRISANRTEKFTSSRQNWTGYIRRNLSMYRISQRLGGGLQPVYFRPKLSQFARQPSRRRVGAFRAFRAVLRRPRDRPVGLPPAMQPADTPARSPSMPQLSVLVPQTQLEGAGDRLAREVE